MNLVSLLYLINMLFNLELKMVLSHETFSFMSQGILPELQQ